MKTTELTRMALMTAILCILAPISIPVPAGNVSMTLATFALSLMAYILPPRQALFSVTIYLLLGAAGLPVFAGYLGGISRFASPGGGYLIGYLLLTTIGCWFVQKYVSSVMQIFGLFLGTLVMYIPGTFWMSLSAGISFLSALSAGMFIFLPFDIIKLLLAVSIGRKTRQHIK